LGGQFQAVASLLLGKVLWINTGKEVGLGPDGICAIEKNIFSMLGRNPPPVLCP